MPEFVSYFSLSKHVSAYWSKFVADELDTRELTVGTVESEDKYCSVEVDASDNVCSNESIESVSR